MKPVVVLFVLLLLACTTLTGCGGDSGPKVEVAPVSGVVKLQGQPIANPRVTFYPESGPTGVGIGNEAGEFTIKTNGRLGAPVGSCRVTVVAANQSAEIPEMDGNEAELAVKPTLNFKYANPDTTDLVIEVPAGGDEDLQLDLDS